MHEVAYMSRFASLSCQWLWYHLPQYSDITVGKKGLELLRRLTDFCFLFVSEAEVMSEKTIVGQPRPYIMTTGNNEWTSGICDCFQDLPQCKCVSLFLCILTRYIFRVSDMEIKDAFFMTQVETSTLHLKSISRA